MYQEEDFVTHTFNRNLLENISHDSVQQLLEDTVEQLLQSRDMPPEFRDALIHRLRFRSTFLKTVETADSRTSTDAKSLWTETLAIIPTIRSTAKLGKPFPTSFSAKLQRKLASTVPPRPIIQLSQDSAFDHLERLCQDGAVVVEVLNYYDSHSLIVCFFY